MPAYEETPPIEDLKGQWVIPGLFDMHTHSWGNDGPHGRTDRFGTEKTSLKMLYAGITGFLDLGGDEEILKVRQKQRDGKTRGSRIFAAGKIFHAKSNAKDVRNHAKTNPDVIKIIFDYRHEKHMSRKTLKAIINEAKKLKIPVVVHIGEWKNAEHASLDGASAITHLCEDETITPAALKAMKASKVYSIPTMAVQLDMVILSEKPSYLDNPLLIDLTSKELRDAYRKMKTDSEMDRHVEWQKEGRDFDKASLKKIHSTGIPLLTGSDAANYGTFQGYSLHREVELFGEIGVPAWDTLKAATVSAGDFLGFKSGIEEGLSADLVVLKRNPIQDLRAIQEITDVYFEGAKVDRPSILKESF